MKIVLASLALGLGMALVGPAQAAEPVATDKPVQLVQQPDHQAADKEKHAKKDVRSNKGGAERGDARSDNAQTTAKGKPQ